MDNLPIYVSLKENSKILILKVTFLGMLLGINKIFQNKKKYFHFRFFLNYLICNTNFVIESFGDQIIYNNRLK